VGAFYCPRRDKRSSSSSTRWPDNRSLKAQEAGGLLSSSLAAQQRPGGGGHPPGPRRKHPRRGRAARRSARAAGGSLRRHSHVPSCGWLLLSQVVSRWVPGSTATYAPRRDKRSSSSSTSRPDNRSLKAQEAGGQKRRAGHPARAGGLSSPRAGGLSSQAGGLSSPGRGTIVPPQSIFRVQTQLDSPNNCAIINPTRPILTCIDNRRSPRRAPVVV